MLHSSRTGEWPRWLLLAGLIALLDHVVKLSVASSMLLGTRVEIAPFFNLVHVRNPGAAFSFLAGAGGWQRYFFIALAFAASAWLIWMLRRNLPRLAAAAYALILAGTLGNVADRVARGQVVDYLDFYWRAWHWPAFNLADVAISLGAICLLGATRMQRQYARSGIESG